MIWLQFVLSAAIIIGAGTQLTKYADILSDRLNLGKVWIGIVLLGLVTSLPEAVASLTSILSLDAIDLAVGNLVGSNNFNPILIVVMDLIYREGSITDKISPKKSHNLSALFAIVLSLIVFYEIWMVYHHQIYSLGHISFGSLAILVLYFVGMKILSVGESKEEMFSDPHNRADNKEPFSKIILALMISATLVVISAIWLVNIADDIATMTGLGGTFVGSIFLALVTSLPEMVVTISAVKLGELDLAVGNIFGSNMTNVFIVFVCDFFSFNGAILQYASKAHMITIVLSVILTTIVLLGIKFKGKKTVFNLGWDSILLLLTFFVGTRILYQLR